MTFLLQPQGQLNDAEEYRKLVIAYRNGNRRFISETWRR